MAIAELTDKIIEDAHRKAEEIRSDAEKDAAQIREEGAAERTKTERDHKAKQDRMLSENNARITSSAEKEVKTQIDAAKREMVNRVFAEVLASLSSLDDDAYAQFVLPSLKSLPKDATGAITVPASRKETSAKLVKDAGLSLEVKTSDAFSGGFVFSDGTTEYTYTFESILSSKKSDLETHVARILFE